MFVVGWPDLVVLLASQVLQGEIVLVVSGVGRPVNQSSHLSLVQVQRGSALIGRELHSVTTPAILCHKEPARASKDLTGLSVCSSLVLYGIKIVGFHARKGHGKAALCHKEPALDAQAGCLWHKITGVVTPRNSPRHGG